MPGAWFVFHADLVRTLKREGARAIAFEFLFSGETDPAQDAAFARAVEEAGNVVRGSVVESFPPGPPIPSSPSRRSLRRPPRWAMSGSSWMGTA